MIEMIKRSLAIAKKDLSIYFIRGPVIIQGLLIPAFLFLSFSFRRNVSTEFLISGLLGMALFFSVSAITPVIAPWETRMRTFERLVSCPIPLWAILLGDVFASVVFGLFITFVVMLVSFFAVGANILNAYLIIGIVLAAFAFSSLGTLISSHPADNPSNIMLFSTLLKFPLVFVSGVFIKLEQMGRFRFLAYLSPLTYFTDIARYSIEGSGFFPPLINIIILFLFAILFYFASVFLHRKNLSKRF